MWGKLQSSACLSAALHHEVGTFERQVGYKKFTRVSLHNTNQILVSRSWLELPLYDISSSTWCSVLQSVLYAACMIHHTPQFSHKTGMENLWTILWYLQASIEHQPDILHDRNMHKQRYLQSILEAPAANIFSECNCGNWVLISPLRKYTLLLLNVQHVQQQAANEHHFGRPADCIPPTD